MFGDLVALGLGLENLKSMFHYENCHSLRIIVVDFMYRCRYIFYLFAQTDLFFGILAVLYCATGIYNGLRRVVSPCK